MTQRNYPIPTEVNNNIHINVYTVLDEDDHIVFQAKRVATPEDKPTVMVGSVIKKDGEYYGEWVDNTEAAKEEAKAKKKSNTFHNPSEVVASKKKSHDDELARAEALLAKLMEDKDEEYNS